LQDSKRKVELTWSALGLGGAKYAMRDLWTGKNAGSAMNFSATLGPHGCVLYRVHAVASM
jgi:Alpha galactosidase C-terminal beta sandwich domain